MLLRGKWGVYLEGLDLANQGSVCALSQGVPEIGGLILTEVTFSGARFQASLERLSTSSDYRSPHHLGMQLHTGYGGEGLGPLVAEMCLGPRAISRAWSGIERAGRG